MIDPDFEDQVLAKSLQDVSYLKKASKILESHHFSTAQHSWVWACVKEVYDKYKICCSLKLIVANCKRDHKVEDRATYLELVKKLVRMDTEEAVAALDQLEEFVLETNAQLALEKAAKALEKNKIKEVYEIMGAAAQKQIKRATYTHEAWVEGFSARQEERKYRSENPGEFMTIPTGFKKLDSILDGGTRGGELSLILGSTGKGKSIALNNIAHSSVFHNYPTLYMGFEMSAQQISMRQDARWLGLEYKKFKNYDFTFEELTTIESKLKRLRKKLENKLRIVSMPVRSADMNTVRSVLDDLWNDYKFEPKCIIFDSLDHLKPIGRGESTRLDQAEIYWLAKGLAEERNVSAWSSTQVAKEFANKIATAESASESYDKARIADLMLSINEPTKKSRATKPVVEDDGDWDEKAEAGGILPEIMAKGRYLELFVAKSRDSESKITIPLDADFAKMLIRELSDELDME